MRDWHAYLGRPLEARAPGPLCGGLQPAMLDHDAAVRFPKGPRLLAMRPDPQEYEYIRFDALAWLAHRMRIPLYATFQGGDRTLSWIEAIARQASLRACSGLIVASAAERERLSKAYPRIPLDMANIANPIDVEEWKAIARQEARKSLGLPSETFIAAITSASTSAGKGSMCS